ncbi:GNAT family N-acetyltransferase [Amycolatopsis aidingensis]|uniref:GNAT family N-acetyltransferase n=1 Tax=Amycolatopsis aidingensis TaxID=2842453 RepID=UPI001C0B0FDF|nr:GNAT family protein [Amycolatopsis aidingensis]
MLRPEFPIRTARLDLRPFTMADLAQVHAYQSRADVARYLYWEPRSAAEVEAALARRLTRDRLTREGDCLSLAVRRLDTGDLIGELNLDWLSEPNRSGEIGFIFHPDQHGNGFATEAATELLRLGFAGLGLHRIIARCDARNAASAGVMARLGMRREAHLRHSEIVKGRWADTLIYAMLDTEWPPGT